MGAPGPGAQDHFDRAVTNAMRHIDSGGPDAAAATAIMLMNELVKHPGTAGVLDARRQGDLMMAVFDGPDATRRFIQALPRPGSAEENHTER